MKKTKRQKPKLPRVLSELNLGEQLEEEKYIHNGLIENQVIHVQEYEKVFFDQLVFKNVSFVGSFFELLECADVIFDHCDFSNAELNQAVFHRVEFIHCKMTGCHLSEAHFRHVSMNHTLAPYVEFNHANFKQVLFEESVLEHANFFEAKLEAVEFVKSKLNEASFYEVRLNGIDISTCEFERISVSSEQLAGCIISPEQAIGFVKAFGMVVKES
ncbi:pentapeptide repeat-containing protein [Alkalihalobacillus sp. 1P02AB]|uniref:pentapeptide repeat-containing protein n=1 Tax=Alkalihalobacillus sp. 1P02AB TaxID=3132260 RepID=UPI0039A44CF9